MGNVRVKVKISHIAVGSSPAKTSIYSRGQVFECTEELAAKLGKDIEILGTVELQKTPAKK